MNKNDFTAQPGARYAGTIAPHPSLHLPIVNDNSLAVAPQADGGGGQALLPPIDAATMSLLEANGVNNATDGIDWGETSSPNEDDLGLLFWDDMAPGSGTGDDPLSFGLGTRTGSALSTVPAPAPVPAAPQPPSPVAIAQPSPMPVDGNACQVQQHHAFAGTQAVVNGSAPVGDLLRLGAAAAQGQGIHAVQQANPAVQQAVQQVQANSQAQYQIQYMGGVPVLTQVVPDQQQQQQRRQNLIQTAQMMTTLQQLQFAQAQQLAQTQTARTQQQQVAQTQAQAAQAQAAQAQQLAQAAQLQKAQQQTAQQAQQQATASAAQSQYAPSNQTLQPQVQAQNQFVQQNPQLINNGTATASPVSHAVDQSLNAVVSQQPQAATIPASAQPYYLWLLQQQQALQSQSQQAQTAQSAQGVVGLNGQSLAINQMQILQALQLNQAQNGTAFPQQAHAIQATQGQVSSQPVVQGINAIQQKVPQNVPAHLQQLYHAQQDALKNANDAKSKNPAHRKPKKGSYQELEASLGEKVLGMDLAPNQSGGAKSDPPQHPSKHARPAPLAQETALAHQALVQAQHRQGIPQGSVASMPFAIASQQHHSQIPQAMIQPPVLSKPAAMPAYSQPPNPLVSSDTESSNPRKKRRVSATSTSFSGLSESTADDKGVKAKPVKPGTAIHRPLTDEERSELTRERNREHAKNTRLRKKAYVEHLKTSVDELCRERDSFTAERANEAQTLVDTHSKRIAVLRSFFALRAGYNIHQQRELWESILDESSFHAVCPVTPYQSFPSSEVQVANCQRTILGVDAMISDAASNYVFLDSLIDRSKYPNARIKFQYTLVTEEAVVSGNQLMARWSMATTNAKKCGSAVELKQSGMLVAKFNSAHKIVALEFMFDVMAFMLQIKMAMGYSNFNDVVIPNTYQTCQKEYYFPAVTTEAKRSHKIVQVNSRWEQMTGYKSEEVVGKASCSILQGADSSRKEIEQLMSPVLYKRPSCAMLTNYTKSGRKFRQYITIYPLSTDSNITHYLGLTTFVQWLDDAEEEAEDIQAVSEATTSSDDKATCNAKKDKESQSSLISSSGSEGTQMPKAICPPMLSSHQVGAAKSDDP